MKKTIIITLFIGIIIPLILSSCVAPHDHDYMSEVTKKATCKEAGVKTFTCSICKDTYTEEIPKTSEHNYKEELTKEPTCTEKGEKKLTCSVCGESHKEEMKANGHTWTEKITKQPTCTKAGKKKMTCSVCGETKTAKVKALGHDYKINVIKEATYYKTGKVKKTCSRCGKAVTSTVPKRTIREIFTGTWKVREVSCMKFGTYSYIEDVKSRLKSTTIVINDDLTGSISCSFSQYSGNLHVTDVIGNWQNPNLEPATSDKSMVFFGLMISGGENAYLCHLDLEKNELNIKIDIDGEFYTLYLSKTIY